MDVRRTHGRRKGHAERVESEIRIQEKRYYSSAATDFARRVMSFPDRRLGKVIAKNGKVITRNGNGKPNVQHILLNEDKEGVKNYTGP